MDKGVISRVNCTARRQLMVGCRWIEVRSATNIFLRRAKRRVFRKRITRSVSAFDINWTTCGTDKSGCMRVFVLGCGQVYAAIFDLYNKGTILPFVV